METRRVWRVVTLLLSVSLVMSAGAGWAQEADAPATSKKDKKKAEEEKKKKEEEEKKVKQTKETLGTVKDYVLKYFATNLKMPDSLAQLTEAPNPVTSSVPQDAWGKPLQYKLGKYSFESQEFELVSGGPDGKLGTSDDIKVANGK